MNDNELKIMEQESVELFALLREVRDEDNASVRIATCPCSGKKRSLRISPYWLVAASVLGFVFGMSVPRGNGKERKFPIITNDNRSVVDLKTTNEGIELTITDRDGKITLNKNF